ncbi:MAG: hypothetical protein AAF567_09670 [Actinomycetota bacterium]
MRRPVNRPSLRLTLLHRSIARQLPDGIRIGNVAMMFTRHRWFFPYCLAAGLVLFLVAAASGIAETPGRLAIAIAGAGVAALATTNYWVLAETDDDLVLLRSSRVRQRAIALVRSLDPGEVPEMVGSTVVTSDWRIDGTMYTVTKRWEAALREMSLPR